MGFKVVLKIQRSILKEATEEELERLLDKIMVLFRFIHGKFIAALFLAHLVYQPKSLMQSCFVVHHPHWHCPTLALSSVHTSPGTWLDIETSYLVYICTYVPHMCISDI